MKERPILFSAPMIRAILDGRKTQTRRVVKPQPSRIGALGPIANERTVRCPFGQLGDRLWVREAWALTKAYDRLPVSEKSPGGWKNVVRRRADEVHEGALLDWGRWRPSMHMPRWASRITLEITGVRVERLQDIASADARKEGIECHEKDGTEWFHAAGRDYHIAKLAFFGLWDSINGNRAPWASNPWVWVIKFKRVI